MKKILLLLCCLHFISTSYADEKKEVELREKSTSNKVLRPYSLLGIPAVNQDGDIISVFARNASSINISIVNIMTQEEVHHAVYGGNEAIIDLSNCKEGTYTIYITVNETEYYGIFILS